MTKTQTLSERLATVLIRDLGHLPDFEVDPLDSAISKSLAKSLQEKGCRVEQKRGSTCLEVFPIRREVPQA